MNANSTFGNAASGPMTALDTLPENGEGKIILCDINGTLFTVRGLDTSINHIALTFLSAAQDRGYEVYLHSGNAGNNQSLLVLAGKINRAFGAFLDDLAARLIAREIRDGARDADDDTLPNYAISKGDDIPFNHAFLMLDDEHYNTTTPIWGPTDPRIAATLQAWGVDVPATAPKGASAPATPAQGPA